MKIGNTEIGIDKPVYFIADVGSNHDGSLEKAKKLAKLCKDSGADCVKFQNFRAKTIVSDYGFKHLNPESMSHQAKWDKSVYEVYDAAATPLEWTKELKKYCDEIEIEYMTSPYDKNDLDVLNQYLNAIKIGSGDITWHDMIAKIASKGKPVLIATGASTIDEVERAIKVIQEYTDEIVLMQCNTNYTASDKNYDHINLNVLLDYKKRFPDVLLGLSDHTFGSVTTLGAVTLGARVIEKHFTDDNNNVGPDHKFAMNPTTWKQMVDDVRTLERSLGDGIKRIEENETDTVIIQRRCLRVNKDLPSGSKITIDDIDVLRPCPSDAFLPYQIEEVLGKTLKIDIVNGDHLRKEHF